MTYRFPLPVIPGNILVVSDQKERSLNISQVVKFGSIERRNIHIVVSTAELGDQLSTDIARHGLTEISKIYVGDIARCIQDHKTDWGIITAIVWDLPIPPSPDLSTVYCTSGVTIQVTQGDNKYEAEWSPPSWVRQPNIPELIVNEFIEDDIFDINTPTYISVNERFQVYQLVRQYARTCHRPLTYLDVGVGTGRISQLIQKACQREDILAKGIGIDPYPFRRCRMDQWKHYKMISDYLHSGIHKVLNILENGIQYLDIVVIDADYSQPGVHTACQLLSPLVRPGGNIIWGHYYDKTVSIAKVKARYDDIRVPHIPCETAQTIGQEGDFHTQFTKTEYPILYPHDESPPQGWMQVIEGVCSSLGIFQRDMS